MGTCVCACGAKYRFAESAAGRQARCKRCGVSLTLHESVEPPGGIPTPIIETSDEVEISTVGYGPERGYGRALFWTFLFPASVQNLAAFLTLWIIFGMLEVLPGSMGIASLRWFVFGYMAGFFWLAVFFWWIAFQVAVVETAAAGQFQLPSVQISGDILVDLFEPVGRWLGSCIIAFGPMLAYTILQAYQGKNVIGDTWEALTVPQLVGVPGPVVDPALMSLLIVGLFFWPMVLMVAVIGGFGYLWRLDLLLYSLGNTLRPYLITVLIVMICGLGWFVVQLFLNPSLVTAMRAPTIGAFAQVVATRFLGTGIEVYLAIIVARAIGLYFHHFGHLVGWDWGQKEELP